MNGTRQSGVPLHFPPDVTIQGSMKSIYTYKVISPWPITRNVDCLSSMAALLDPLITHKEEPHPVLSQTLLRFSEPTRTKWKVRRQFRQCSTPFVEWYRRSVIGFLCKL